MARTQLSPAGSIERDEAENAAEAKTEKTRRPPNTAFRQQRLKAWQPILTPKTVLPLFFLVGIIFAPIGGLLLYASDLVQELSIDYTDCSTLAPLDEFADMDSNLISSHFKSGGAVQPRWSRQNISVGYGRTGQHMVPTVECTLQFTIPNDIGSPVLLYYRLTKFYQNHRRYVKSVSQDQMEGKALSNDSIGGSNCDPLTLNAEGKAYFPCGLIANSLFNDTFLPSLARLGAGVGDATYEMTTDGIAWSSDASLYKNTSYTADQVVPPPNWVKRYPNGYDNDEFPLPSLSSMPEFQVWMRTAGLPTFSKLALRNDDTPMPMGTYQLRIYDDFPVHLYGGTKEILISTRTIIGGKNPFLGIAYIIIGGICILLGAGFTAMHLIKPRKLGDHTYLTWNNDQPTAATATGRSLRPNDAA